MARLTGLEPATPGVTGRYSNQLSYNRSLPLENPSVRRVIFSAVTPVKQGLLIFDRKDWQPAVGWVFNPCTLSNSLLFAVSKHEYAPLTALDCPHPFLVQPQNKPAKNA